MKNLSFEVGVISQLGWSARHPEDGERREVEFFTVVIEREDGARWSSIRVFRTAEAAERCIPAVERRLASGETPVDSAHWAPTWPRYGSEAYLYGEAGDVARERHQDKTNTYYDGGIYG